MGPLALYLHFSWPEASSRAYRFPSIDPTKAVPFTMAAVPSIESLVLNFQRIASLSGKEEPATPVCKGLPRKMGQSVVVFAAGSVFLLSAANTSAPVKRAHATSNGRLIEHSPDSTEAIP